MPDETIDVSGMTLAELRKQYNYHARVLYGAIDGSNQERRTRAMLGALKAEAERRGKSIRPAAKLVHGARRTR